MSLKKQQYSFNSDFEKLFNETKSFKIISFDIFDTLVYRPIVDPKSLFDIVERQLVKNYGGQYVNFSIYRVLAEDKARKKAEISGFQEVNLDEIYHEIKNLYHDEGQKNIDLKIVKTREQEVEIQYILPITKARDFFNQLKNTDKKIILISDIYLPKDTIIKMLHAAGYNIEDIDIYVSCEPRLSKHHTDLYRWVLECNDWEITEQLHFGDNEHSDVRQAEKAGITAIHLKTLAFENSQYFGHNGTIAYNTHQLQQSVGLGLLQYRRDTKTLPHNQNSKDNYWYLLGYNLIGSFMASLALWVNEEAQKHNSEKILFLARDGQIVKEVYDILLKNTKHAPSAYCYSSRRMISLPSAAVSSWNLYLFYEDIILNSTNFHEALKKIPGGEKLSHVVLEQVQTLDEGLKKNKQNQQILKNCLIENSHLVFDSMAPEKTNVMNYLNDVISGSENISLFDIGWKGSLQRGIEEILDAKKINIQGLYFGLQKDAKFNNSLSRAQGFCLNYGHPLAHQNIIQQSVELFELFFYATHSSVETVVKNNKNEWEAKLFDIGPSEEKRLHIAKILHQGATDFAEDITDIYSFEDINHICAKDIILDNILNFASNPSKQDAKYFIDIDFASAIGDDKGKPLISPLVQAHFHINSNRPISKSRWKNGARAMMDPSKDKKQLSNIYQWQKRLSYNIIKLFKG